MFLIPIERARRATVHLNSGAEIEFMAAGVEVVREEGNSLSALTGHDSRGSFPFYVRLDDISAIEVRRSLRLKRFSRYEWLGWAVIIAAAVYVLAIRP